MSNNRHDCGFGTHLNIQKLSVILNFYDIETFINHKINLHKHNKIKN